MASSGALESIGAAWPVLLIAEMNGSRGGTEASARLLATGQRRLADRALVAELSHHLALPLSALTADRIREVRPYLVLSWLVGERYDALEIAERLESAGFQGRYFAFALDMTHAEMIAREVRAAAPSLAFEVIGPET